MKAKFNPANFKVVFFGTPQFSVPCLSALKKKGFDIVKIITQPDTFQGRGQKLTPTPVKTAAQELGIEVWQPDKLNEQIIIKLQQLKADLFIVVAYGEFLPAGLIDMTKFGTVNIHPSLLPKYRGPSPIQWALLHGDSITGNSLMLIDKEMDHGPILDQSRVNIDPSDDTNFLSQKLSLDAAQLLIRILPYYLAGKINPKEQNHDQASFSKLISKQDAQVDWSDNAENILNKIRAYNPWPVVQVSWDNKILKIYRACISQEKLSPGQIKIDMDNKKIYIGTSTLSLEIVELQLPGKKRLTAKEFINGLR